MGHSCRSILSLESRCQGYQTLSLLYAATVLSSADDETFTPRGARICTVIQGCMKILRLQCPLACWKGTLHARSVVLLVSARPAINTSKLIYLNTPSGIPQESGQSRTHIDRSRCAHSSTCRASRAQTFQSSLKSCVDLFHDITAFSFRPLLAPPMSLQPTSTDFRSSKPTMFGRPCHSVPRAKQSLRPCAAV